MHIWIDVDGFLLKTTGSFINPLTGLPIEVQTFVFCVVYTHWKHIHMHLRGKNCINSCFFFFFLLVCWTVIFDLWAFEELISGSCWLLISVKDGILCNYCSYELKLSWVWLFFSGFHCSRFCLLGFLSSAKNSSELRFRLSFVYSCHCFEVLGLRWIKS